MILLQLTADDLRAIIRDEVSRLQEDDTMTRAQTAKMLRVSVGTVANMEKRGNLTRIDSSGHPKYRKSEVIKLIR